MIVVPSGAQVWLAAGITDMRRGLTGLSALVQTALADNPYGGHVFVFRGRRGDLCPATIRNPG
jgi:transposase